MTRRLLSEAPNLWWPVLESPEFERLRDRVERGTRGTCLTGLADGGRAVVLGGLVRRLGRPLIVVVPDDAVLDHFRRDLSAFGDLSEKEPLRTLILPALDADPYDSIAPHPEVVRERVVALERLQQKEFDVLLTPSRALLQWLPAPEEWERRRVTVENGTSLPPDRFVLDAIGLGYRRADTVSAPGEISRRGGIIDIFPPTSSEPIRIELFADTVESLRTFDTDDQRSTGNLERVTIGAASECPPTDEALAKLSEHLEAGRAGAEDDLARARRFRARLDQLTEQGYWPGFETLSAMTSRTPSTLLDYDREAVLVVEDPERAEEELLRASHEMQAAYEQSEERVLPPPSTLYVDAARARDDLRSAMVLLEELAGSEPEWADETIAMACRRQRNYSSSIPDLVAELRRGREEGRTTICMMRAAGSAERLGEILGEYDLSALEPTAAAIDEARRSRRGATFLTIGPARCGFEFPELALQVITEREVFGETTKSRGRKEKKGRGIFISDFRDLKPGDHVVHVDHGIARYAGLGRPKGGSLNRDFMMLEFAGKDRLFVPVDRLDLVQKYRGAAGAKPTLDKLGGPGWSRVKSRVRKSVQSMAKELLELYAKRRAARGHVFSPDTDWQQELEAAFPHDLTPDQVRVVEEIKSEMESERVMDRLLVGDVGFGKTEVAVRAAFKAVQDGFQVAVLAPTTVLAFQHFRTFSARYAPFPVRVELVSRFRSAAETKKVIEETALGGVDVLIGTHRIFSKDVKFKKLGLLVIDEEQRFGVAHKERLKQLSIGVDVLSMTATPIPRTLQMSLAGVRDLSVIETPPPGRMSIQTYMVPFRQRILAQALRAEIRRHGQVFFVHNRVESLPAIARMVTEMVPEARVAVAHGQMPEKKLEQVMLSFVRNEADILVTTTIIENGLDIPRANTIVIHRADRFGLAQLYQLRGRVGRSHVPAYAYLVVPGRDELSDDARKRLKALQEFSDLGAGFRLAAIDLEIRGAGEMLGSRQHGHIASLGFDLYCQMLEQAVQEIQGEPVAERQPPSLHLRVDIKVPETYMRDAGQRLTLYKRLAQASDRAEVDRLRSETEDRFGHLPVGARNLFDVATVRVLAETAGVKSVDLVDGDLQIRFHDEPPLDPQRVIDFAARQRGSLSPAGSLRLPGPAAGRGRVEHLEQILERLLEEAAA